MADFSPDYTPRYKMVYRAAGVQHNFGLRFARGTANSAVLTNGRTIINALFGAFTSTRLAADFDYIAEYFAEQDSNVFQSSGFLPTPPAGTAVVADFTPAAKVTSWSISGKSSESKTRVVMYGLQSNPYDTAANEAKLYVLSSEETELATAIAALNAGSSCGGDGTEAVYYPRANVDLNDFLKRAVRRGIIS